MSKITTKQWKDCRDSVSKTKVKDVVTTWMGDRYVLISFRHS